jgi:murein DD-endopeptidase MepM/ murein hydrolase activator NlpD
MTQPVRGKLVYAPDGCISQKFNDPHTDPSLLAWYKSYGLDGHNGVDFVSFRGDNIYASHSGKVVFARNCGNVNGNMTKIVWEEDGSFWGHIYAHQEEILVKEGESVTEGQIIGLEGNSGSSQQFYMGVHLHFGMYEYMDDTYTSVKNFSNGFHGAIDSLPLLLKNNIENKNMLKIIGDSLTKKQYLQGKDGSFTWIYNVALLNFLHDAGICDKTKVEWRSDFNKELETETLALIK